MLLGGAGLTDVNILFSDVGALRNEDFVTNAGFTFSAGDNQAGTSAQFSHVQLLNPASSGVIVFIDSLLISGGAAMNISLRAHDTALTLVTAWIANRLGQSDGNAALRKGVSASLLGTQIGTVLMAANIPIEFPLEFPIQLDEGKGILIAGHNANVPVTAFYKGREVSL